MAAEVRGTLEIEDRGAVLVARVDGGPLGLFGNDIAEQLAALVDRADGDPNVHAVVFTGTHPERFVSHAEVRWLQEGGAAVPPVGVRGASALAYTAKGVNRAGGLRALLGKTPLWPAVQLERVHQTFLKMNRSGVIFVAALNGSALGLGAEFSWANDLRVMADGDFFIGQPEVLLGIMPGGGGTQRLTRLIGTHRSLLAIIEGKPFTPAEAVAIGAVDDVVAPEQVLTRAIELAEHFGSRTKGSIAAIKRSVYFGGSMPLTDGLHVERAEFLATALSTVGQGLMLDYMATTDATGELPLYSPGVYAEALEAGTVPGIRNGTAVKP
ncbi:Enoyl-CoA hydratase/carnithine racemase [Actinokineospora alba]|uniref:Enoyl-CoA hydratase/carnithine racemase n=1 Tax=Actinokineospora alba TaxID=504798 RepID=A0A1H0FCN0_9PSEU|nr:enoyl-CoA hydratase/isomerase family protein [Actinokineospora alba]TDP69428.1 enoyl-CoA hydratase/carnithine racemase [Actinokineospora alba]SDI17011.1 Enoyl-CoA hydratase/carnithine racemase [Actinokineospora alba]SDN92404.1 Enoyl-CoA hydratase/carnithine racemase [Actinokineospora alba]